MGVFTVDDALRAAAIDAGHELGLFEALASPLSLAQLAEATHLRPTHRFAALVDALIALGALSRSSNDVERADAPFVDDAIAARRSRLIARGSIPPRSSQLMTSGWGAIADVIRRDAPLVIEDADIARRYQRHLVAASAPAAREVARMLVATHLDARHTGANHGAGHHVVAGGEEKARPAARALPGRLVAERPRVRDADNLDGGALASDLPRDGDPDRTLRVIDIGGGAGAYSRALLEAYPRSSVTIVDLPEVIELAREELGEFGERVCFLAGDARELDLPRDAGEACDVESGGRVGEGRLEIEGRRLGAGELAGFDVAIVANVLHLHSSAACLALCNAVGRIVAPGGLVAIVDLRRGSLEGEMFALNMALYTDGGSVYSVERIHRWLDDAGFVSIEERSLEEAPEMMVVLGVRHAAAVGPR